LNPFVEWNDNSKEAVRDAEGENGRSARKQDEGRQEQEAFAFGQVSCDCTERKGCAKVIFRKI